MANPYPLLVDALRLLPGIQPVHELCRLGEARHRALISRDQVTAFDGLLLTLAQLEELFVYGEHGGPRVSPEGAKVLLHLFEENAFECANAYLVPGGLDLLRQYSNGEASIIDYSPRRMARQVGEAEKSEGLARSTSLSIV